MCRTGCKTKDHASYAECLRASSPRIGYSNEARRLDATAEKKWRKELQDYRDAIKQGIEPAGTDRKSIDYAIRVSNETGKAYDAHERHGV